MYIIQKTEYFETWLRKLHDIRAKAKILAKLKRAELGNLGDHKSVGHSIFEMRIDYGPGYRLYFKKSKNVIIILLWDGDKSTQSSDIRKSEQIAIESGVYMSKITPFDVSEYLEDEKTIVEYLNAIIEEDDPSLLLSAIGDIAKARGMSKIAIESGLGRESLYKALNPSSTIPINFQKSLA
ncbi:MAG: type II toxin-antitoxin system RelE/ParE family toxin [Fibrobacterota bacterium]